MPTLEQAQAYFTEAEQLLAQDKYADAIALLEQAAPVFEQNADWERLAACLNLHSECCYKLGSYNDSIQKAEQALDLSLKLFGECHEEIANSYNHLGIAYWTKGNINKAIGYHLKTLSIKRKVYGVRHQKTAESYINLGVCYRYIGDYVKSIACNLQGIAIFQETLGEEHINLGMCYVNLGICYREKGNYIEAINFYQKAHEIFLNIYGELHLKTVFCIFNTAVCYYELGNVDKAIDFMQQTITKFQILEIKDNQLMGKALNNQGYNYLKKNLYAQAQSFFKQSLSIKLEIFGELHPSTCVSYRGLAKCFKFQNNFPLAFYYLKKSLQSLDIFIPDDNDYFIPNLKIFNSARELIDSLTLKGNVFLTQFQQTPKLEDLTASLAHFQCADRLIDLMRQSYKTEGSKLTLAENS